MILLDTDIMVDVLREYPPAIAWLESNRNEELLLPGFVVMELIQGCRNKSEQEKVRWALSGYEILWPAASACNEALSVFGAFRLSHGLGIIDVLIGQLAVEHGAPLCTFNQKHYAMIPGLITMQPYAKPSSEQP